VTTAPVAKRDRTKSIGGSDLAAVFNLPPYGCRRRLWYEKTATPSDYPFVETAPMRRGKFFEKYEDRFGRHHHIVRDFYEHKTGLHVAPGPINLTDPKRPWSTGELDGRVTENGVVRPWECKVPGEFVFRKVKREGMDDSYILQLMKYMYLDNANVGTFAVFHADTVDMLTFDLERDTGLVFDVLHAERSFWNDVTKRKIPDRLESVDKRCSACLWRTTCQGEAILESIKDDGDEIPFDPSLDALMEEYAQVDEIFNEAKALREGVKGRIKVAIGDRPAVQTTGARIHFRPQTSNRYNADLLAASLAKTLSAIHPDATFIASAITGTHKSASVSRPLRIYPT
jgi:predicted phage-related endonuclease